MLYEIQSSLGADFFCCFLKLGEVQRGLCSGQYHWTL